VYNLQTTEEWYIANGIVVYNCRCSPVPVVDGMNPLGSGEDWLRGQPGEVQEALVPKSLYPEWRSGRVKLTDFVQPTSDPTWGSGYKQAPIPLVRANAAQRLGLPARSGPAPEPAFRSPSGLSYDPAHPPQAILDAEARIRPQRFETAIGFDAQGREVFRKDGQQYAVNITEAEAKQLKDGLLTHNHPRGWDVPANDPRRPGTSLGDADLMFAASQADVAAIRAVGPGRTYTMERPEEGWGKVLGQRDMPADVLQRHQAGIDQDIRSEFEMQVNTGRMTPAEAESRHHHEKSKRLAQRLGWHYTVQEAPR
jgi:hypothetical protein